MENKCKEIVFSGDIFNNHSLISLEVVSFYRSEFSEMCKNFKVIIIAGNHDMSGLSSSHWAKTSLSSLNGIDNLRLIEYPQAIDGWAYIPYSESLEKFKEAIKELSHCKIAFTHQSYEGSAFDNGYFDPNGFPIDSVSSFDMIINGHIHTQTQFANIWTIGSPKWDTLSDANKEKFIWLHDGIKMTPISVDGIIPKVISLELKENDPPPELNPKDKNYLTLIGSSKWIASTSKDYKGIARIVPKPTDAMTINKKQSYSTFKEFLTNQKLDVNLEDVLKRLKILKRSNYA